MGKIISVSMLSADFGHLERDTKLVDRSRAEWVHIDVMDGVFVPNISFGFPVLKSIKAATGKFIDTHIMIVNPEKYVERFVKAGSDMVTFHLEATDDPRAVAGMIHAAGGKAGISIKPATPVSALKEILPYIDMVLIMSVEPGFGGQSFIEGSQQKARDLRAMIAAAGLDVMIEMDGGIGPHNAAELFAAGCDALVAGSAIFGSADPLATIDEMLK